MPQSKESKKLYKIGADVMAKWPKSNLYFKGKVIDFNDVEYLVQFQDEGKSEYPIKFKDVTLSIPNQSRSRSRGRSPGRSKSATRKSPARKSPGRKVSSPKKSPSSSITEITSLRTRSSRATERTVLSDSSGRRQSARLADKSTEKTKKSVKQSFSSIVDKYCKGKLLPLTKRFCMTAWMTSSSLLLPTIILLSPFILSLMCSAKSCSFSWVEFPQKLSSYYDQKAVVFSVGFTLSLLILSLLPVGKVVKTKGGSQIRCNGYMSLLVLTVVMVTALRMQYNLSPLYLLFRHFLVTFSAFSVLFSFAVYIKSFFVTKSSLYSKGNTGYHVYDFVKGRELNPKIGTFDIKFFIFRLAIFLILVLNYLIVAKELQSKNGQFSPTVLVCCGLQIFAALDMIVFEETFLSSFDYLRQGTGLMTMGAFLSIPFLFTIYGRFILNHGSEQPWYVLVGAGVVFLMGYAIFRGSSSQGHAFRMNPNDPALAHLESIPASGGKRLLVSGWCGFVRHPNLLGEILCHLSFALLCGLKFCVPHVVTLLFLSCCVAQSLMEDKAFKSEFGLAWNTYVARVPYRLLPKIF